MADNKPKPAATKAGSTTVNEPNTGAAAATAAPIKDPWFQKYLDRAKNDVIPRAFDLITNTTFQMHDERYFVMQFTASKNNIPYHAELIIENHGGKISTVVYKLLPLVQG